MSVRAGVSAGDADPRAPLPAFALAPARESIADLALRERYGLFVGGAWTHAEERGEFETIDPATETPLARIASATAPDVARAARAARRAYDKYWRKTRPAVRSRYLYRIARALAERAKEFALIETLDTGKPIREARSFDLPLAAAHVFYHAGWADKLAWATLGGEAPRPLGVVGAIVASDFPLLAATWKIAPALACGNTVVLKPAGTTPLSALLLAEIVREADLPPGVVNVVTGGPAAGAAIVDDLEFDKIAFTGSTETGKAIRRANAGRARPLSLSLGGKSAFLLFADADLDQAIEGVVSAIYFNQGHVCCAGSRLLVHESIATEVVERLTARIERLRHGDPLDANTDLGAIGSRARRDRITEYLRSGVEEGARLVSAPWTPPERGFWAPASFFTNVQPSHRIAREEIPGPVLTIMTFRTPDEAIERADNTPFGLAASVWTNDGALATYVAGRLRAGVVWCNTFNRFDPSAPFGGVKESGFGRDGGVAGLREYLAG